MFTSSMAHALIPVTVFCIIFITISVMISQKPVKLHDDSCTDEVRLMSIKELSLVKCNENQSVHYTRDSTGFYYVLCTCNKRQNDAGIIPVSPDEIPEEDYQIEL